MAKSDREILVPASETVRIELMHCRTAQEEKAQIISMKKKIHFLYGA